MTGIAGLLLVGFLLATLGEAIPGDWVTDFLSDIESSNQKLQADLQRMNEDIQRDVQSRVSEINQYVEQQVSKAQEEVKRVQEETQKVLKENPKDFTSNSNIHISDGGSVILNSRNGNTVVINGKGAKRIIKSGTDANGKPYYTEKEDLIIGDTLFHTDRVYNYTTNKLEETRYTLNLKDPNAKPVYENAKQ